MERLFGSDLTSGADRIPAVGVGSKGLRVPMVVVVHVSNFGPSGTGGQVLKIVRAGEVTQQRVMSDRRA